MNPEADTKASKKPSRMKVVFAVIVVLVLVLGGAYYLVFNQPEEGPPTLGAADQSLYQGLIQTGQYDFLQHDDDDRTAWVDPPEENSLLLEYANSKEGMHLVALGSTGTMKQVLDSMNPNVSTGEFMIASYDEGFSMSPNTFYTAGGASLAVVPEIDMDNVSIDPFQFFWIGSDADIELWGDYYSINSLPATNFDFCAQDVSGWFPGTFSGNVASGFEVIVDGTTVDCLPDELWALNKNTLEFEEQDLASVTTLDTFIWVYYSVAPSDSIAAKLIAMATDTTAPAPITDLTHSDVTATSITLSWTASGDDEDEGTAASYDVRYSTSSITEGNWDSATEATGEPIPSSAGSVENMTVSGLLAETSYYFAIKVSDEAQNESDILNSYEVSTIQIPEACDIENDDLCEEGTLTCVANSIRNMGTGFCECGAGYEVSVAGTSCEVEEPPAEEPPAEEPPAEEPPAEEPPAEEPPAEEPEITVLVAPVEYLTSFDATSTRIILHWTTPEDEELYSYDVRYSDSAITEGNWEEAKKVDNVTYLDQVTLEGIQTIRTHINVVGLTPGTLYHFAVKVLDEAENKSVISNHSASTTGEEVEEPLVIEPYIAEPLIMLEPLIAEPVEEEIIEFEYSFTPMGIILPVATDCGNTETAYKCVTDGSDPAVFIETGAQVCATFWKSCGGLEYSCHNVEGYSSEPNWVEASDDCSSSTFVTNCAYRAECY